MAKPTNTPEPTFTGLSRSKTAIAVIGAGVIGLSIGVRLLESRGSELNVTIIAEKFHPNITSNGAGGFVYPDAEAEPEDERLLATIRHLQALQSCALADEAGVSLVPTFLYFSGPQERPWWAGTVPDFELLTRVEAIQRGLRSESYETVFSFKSYVVEPKKYLPWLMSKFQRLGGTFEQRRVTAIQQLSDYQLVVNCTGLGSRELTGDQDLYPVRGQIVAVRVPSTLKHHPEVHACRDPEGKVNRSYIIPHSDVTLLGGTRDHGNWSQVPDVQQTEQIYKRCLQLVPALEGSEIVETWACLRPMRRNKVRLEFELMSSSVPVVHCYGHGGRGYVVHWGCALEVQGLVEMYLKEKGLL